MTMVAPYDDDHVMAGAGSGALEACAQMGQEPVDLALVCCSGGGMAAGWSVALRALHPEARVVVVEPAGFDDTARSLVAGRRLENERKSGSICDALLAVTPGERTFPILRDNGATGVSVTDEECLAAMHFAFANLKLVLEPGGASALAAALAGKLEMKGRNVNVACSGGNVDPTVFSRCLSPIPHAQAEE
jgi:threonine dehydratase